MLQFRIFKQNISPWVGIEAVGWLFTMIVVAGYFEPFDAVSIVLAMAVAYFVPRHVLHRSRWVLPASCKLYAVLGLGLVWLSTHNLWLCTLGCGATLSNPHLTGDVGCYFQWALHFYDGTPVSPRILHFVHFYGLPVMMLSTWKLLGVSVVWPFAVNLMFTLLSVVMFGLMGARWLQGRVMADGSVVAFWVMLVCVGLGYFIAQGVTLQKEPMNYCGVAMTGYVLAGISNARNLASTKAWREILIFALGCVIVLFTRATMVYFLLLGVVLATAGNVAKWRLSLSIAMVAVIVGYVSMYVLSHDSQLEQQMRVVQNSNWRCGTETYSLFLNEPSQQALVGLVGNYFSYPLWHRVLLLPVTATAQFFIPFPWTTGEVLSLNVVLCRFTFTWYAVGGLCLFYYGAIGWRRKTGLGALALWPVLCYVAVALATAGSVARYVLPFQPVFAIIAIAVVMLLREQPTWRVWAWRWGVVYGILLVATLVVCHHVQQSCMP